MVEARGEEVEQRKAKVEQKSPSPAVPCLKWSVEIDRRGNEMEIKAQNPNAELEGMRCRAKCQDEKGKRRFGGSLRWGKSSKGSGRASVGSTCELSGLLRLIVNSTIRSRRSHWRVVVALGSGRHHATRSRYSIAGRCKPFHGRTCVHLIRIEVVDHAVGLVRDHSRLSRLPRLTRGGRSSHLCSRLTGLLHRHRVIALLRNEHRLHAGVLRLRSVGGGRVVVRWLRISLRRETRLVSRLVRLEGLRVNGSFRDVGQWSARWLAGIRHLPRMRLRRIVLRRVG
jgi:hypothetical protein